jgi:hypothetical protein
MAFPSGQFQERPDETGETAEHEENLDNRSNIALGRRGERSLMAPQLTFTVTSSTYMYV